MVFTAGFRRAASSPFIAGAAPYYSNDHSNNTHTHQQQQQYYNQQYAARPSKKYDENYSKKVWEYISARPSDSDKVENTKTDRKTSHKHETHLPRAPTPTDNLDLVRLPRSPSPGYSSQAQSRGPSRAPSPQRHRSSAGEHRRSERAEPRPPHRQRMNDRAQTPREYWGYLITRDEKPQATPKLKGLLSSIAEYVIENMEPRDVHFLSPDKLAAFYRQVGGDLDDFLIHTPPSRISEIYTTLGCAHSLQSPPNDDFQQPTIPVLSTRGFQTWQTIQLLLEPAEHVAYLQNAVETFELRDPETGEPFPKEIPADCFPTETDQVTFDWHEECFSRAAAEKAKREAAEASAAPATAPHSTTATAGAPSSNPVPSSEDDYYTRPRRRHQKRRPTYAEERDPDLYPRSVPAGYTHERRSSRDPPREHHSHHHSSHSRDQTPRHHSSSRHRTRGGSGGDPYSDFRPTVETPAASDFEDDDAYLSGRKYSHIRPHSRGHSHSRHDYGSRSRSRRTSREYLPDVIPILPVDPYATVVEPVASYIRPEHVVYTHAPPALDYTETETEDDRDVRSRFLRRSTSPLRAPLGGSSSQGGRVHKAYRDEYVAPYDPYEQAELAAQAEQMLHIKELEEKKRRKEERRVRDSYKSEWGYERERERGRRGEAAYGY